MASRGLRLPLLKYRHGIVRCGGSSHHITSRCSGVHSLRYGPISDDFEPRHNFSGTLRSILQILEQTRSFRTSSNYFVEQARNEQDPASAATGDDLKDDKDQNMSKDVEKTTGTPDKLEFQAETRMLLDIVAKSLYSETEIFIRELISNASDALEKFRFLSLSGQSLEKSDRSLEIHLRTNKTDRTITIQDTGIGMTKEEMITNLGTIAHSGSKAFLESLKGSKDGGGTGPNSIIGQFGVGFYSCFMVANSVDVYSKSGAPGSKGFKWSSDGHGSYEIQEAENVQDGTKIVINLKPECRQFSVEENVNEIIKKYSNFVGSPILLNGKQINTVEALWLKDPKSVEPHLHHDFYRFIGGNLDRPRFILHFNIDVPISLRCLLYVPEGIPGMFEMSANSQVGVALYSRKVLIKNKADNVVPMWMRFLKGVVDSEDIPLNLSRELLQQGDVIRKIKTVLVNRTLRFLQEKSQKEEEEFLKFYHDYGIFLKEGIMTESEQMVKEEIGKLLRFESSTQPAGKIINFTDYISRMGESQKDIFYLAAPSRELAERSPYIENFESSKTEVLFCYEQYDEMVLNQLGQFNGRKFMSVEKEVRDMKDGVNLDALPLGSISKSDAEGISLWLQQTLKGRVHEVKFTKNLVDHPCVVTVKEMPAARQFVRLQSSRMPADTLYSILQPRLEINVKHPVIKKLVKLKDTDIDLAQLLANHLFMNAMVEAGLQENARVVLAQANSLLMKTLGDSAK